jgi:uncharacterized protein
MTDEVRPLGVRCNIQCQYCYQNPQRDAGQPSRPYDLEKIKEALKEEGSAFSLFGGEPLLVPVADLEELWRWGFEHHGHSGVQTNGTLIDDEHVRMFRAYNVRVGISIDGPGELNDARWNGTLERTRAATEQAERAIARLCQEGLPPSLIITLHRCNASEERLPRLCEWFRELHAIGVRHVRLHLLEIDAEAVRKKYALSTEGNEHALRALMALQRELPGLRMDLFDDIRRLLRGDDGRTTCTWGACDPYTTRAVQGIEGTGQRSNCGRTNKDGVDFVKASEPGFERYLALYATPQAFGGCQGCRFFAVCKGYCPGTAIDGDWRNRSEQCEALKSVFTAIETEIVEEGGAPLSLGLLRTEIEEHLVRAWANGRNATVSDALATLSRAVP